MPMADRSVTFRFFSPRCSRRSRRHPARSFSTAPSARAAIPRAILAEGADVIALDRDPTAIAARPGAGRGRMAAGSRSSTPSFPSLPIMRPTAGSTASCSISASPPCRSTRPSAASPSRRTARSTCACRHRGVSAADVVNRAKVADLIRIFGFLGEEKQARPHRARHREARAPKSRSTTTRDLAGLIELVDAAQGEGQDPSGDPRLPGAARLRQRRARRTGRRRCLPPSGR